MELAKTKKEEAEKRKKQETATEEEGMRSLKQKQELEEKIRKMKEDTFWNWVKAGAAVIGGAGVIAVLGLV